VAVVGCPRQDTTGARSGAFGVTCAGWTQRFTCSATSRPLVMAASRPGRSVTPIFVTAALRSGALRKSPRFQGETRNVSHNSVTAGPRLTQLRPVLAAIGLVAGGEDRRLDAVLQAEFGEDAADVGLDRLLADLQVPSDLPVAVTAGDQLEYVAFAR
jgi:hypothetical protein